MAANAGTEVHFFAEKVRTYQDFLRKKAQDSLRNRLTCEISLDSASIPVCAWVYYEARAGRLEWESLNLVLRRDQERSRFVVGKDIILYDDVTRNPEEESRYHRAVSLIRHHWPDMGEMLDTLSLRVSQPPHDENYESSSNPRRFGQIYYSLKRQRDIDWAEILVHEAGHQYLFVLTAESREKKYAWETSVYSSIKGTHRPLIGLFHGACAQANMLLLALNILSSKQVPQATKDGALSLLSRYAEGFLKDLQTLEPFGLLEFSPEINAHFGRVSERLGKRIGVRRSVLGPNLGGSNALL